MTLRSIFPLVLAAMLAIAGCSPPTAETTTSTTHVETTSAGETTTSQSSSTTTSEPADTTLPAGTEDLPLEMRQEIAGLVAVTERLRELTFLQPPTIVVVSDDELEERVRSSISEEVEDIPADEALLKLLGLLEVDIDLLQLYLDLYGEQVAGYYDPETGELVVPAGAEFSALQKATLVHELTHALIDQRFGFSEYYRSLVEAEQFDQAVAALSVSEGDATLVELFYIQGLEVGDQQELLQDLFATESDVLDSAPEYLQRSLLFPYREGLAFAQRSFELGGFDEVNRLYLELPDSSEQIINPRDYQRDSPIAVEIVEPELAGYEAVFRSTWGELSFGLMFDQVLGGAEEASDGWGGDAYVQWFDGSEAALLIEYVGDTESDLDEMADALSRYVSTAMAVEGSEESEGGILFDGDDFAFVRRAADRVYFVAAGDPAVGRELVASLP